MTLFIHCHKTLWSPQQDVHHHCSRSQHCYYNNVLFITKQHSFQHHNVLFIKHKAYCLTSWQHTVHHISTQFVMIMTWKWYRRREETYACSKDDSPPTPSPPDWFIIILDNLQHKEAYTGTGHYCWHFSAKTQKLVEPLSKAEIKTNKKNKQTNKQ